LFVPTAIIVPATIATKRMSPPHIYQKEECVYTSNAPPPLSLFLSLSLSLSIYLSIYLSIHPSIYHTHTHVFI
jgi:hypothetical protein